MLHIADIKKYERCPRSFWLSRKLKKPFVPFVNYNESMTALCKEVLEIETDYYEGHAGDEGNLALAALKTHKTLMNARFVYEDMRVKIPFLLQREGKKIVYFTFKTCYPKESEAQGIADNLSVLELLGIQVDEVYAIHLNHNYIREHELDAKEVLVINAYLFNSNNKAQREITDLVMAQKRNIKEMIEMLHACEQQEDVYAKRSPVCTRGNKCIFFNDCFSEPLADTSILNLVQSSKKYEMLEDGIFDMKDSDIDRIEGTRHQYAQIMAAKLGGVFIDKSAMNCWIMDHIKYPLSYLDFEWETYAFPPYKGMKPFDVLPFQYSLHIEEKKGDPLQERGYIGVRDCRIAFIEHLLHDLPKEGTILVYNMEGAEKLRLKQLAMQYPQYETPLRQVWERMVDLSLPFSTGNIYDTRMAGFYSLKTLVPLFSSYNYQDLDISYGVDAVSKWRTYSEAQGDEKDTLYQQLQAYCAMDTYAEYIVYHAIEELANT